MDPASKQKIMQNEKLIKSLNINILEPFLKDSRIFTKSMLSDIYDPKSDPDLFSELPSRGPNAFSRFLEVLENAGYPSEANILKSTSKHVQPRVRAMFYPMESKPLGYYYIINNVEFDHLPHREGSDVDAKELKKLFETGGFEVIVKLNLKGKDMKICLKNFAKSGVLKNVACCFVVILSHGDSNNVIYGTDSYELPKDDIYKIFNNINCEFLRNKPKVFLFQACRGRDEDYGTVSADSTDSPLKSSRSTEYSDAVGVSTYRASSPVLENIPSEGKKLPGLSDILVIHSSLPDHKAYRDHFDGSWLIQDLVSVFSKDYLEQDVENMLKTVSRKLQDRLTITGKKKQVPHTESLGFKALLHLCSNNDYIGCDKNARDYLS